MLVIHLNPRRVNLVLKFNTRDRSGQIIYSLSAKEFTRERRYFRTSSLFYLCKLFYEKFAPLAVM